jgi:hypothetical protein
MLMGLIEEDEGEGIIIIIIIIIIIDTKTRVSRIREYFPHPLQYM